MVEKRSLSFEQMRRIQSVFESSAVPGGFRYAPELQVRRVVEALEGDGDIRHFAYPEDVRSVGCVPVGWLDGALGVDEVFTDAEQQVRERVLGKLREFVSTKEAVSYRQLVFHTDLAEGQCYTVTGGPWGDYGHHVCSVADDCEQGLRNVYALRQGDVVVVFPGGVIHYVETHNWKPDSGFMRMIGEVG